MAYGAILARCCPEAWGRMPYTLCRLRYTVYLLAPYALHKSKQHAANMVNLGSQRRMFELVSQVTTQNEVVAQLLQRRRIPVRYRLP